MQVPHCAAHVFADWLALDGLDGVVEQVSADLALALAGDAFEELLAELHDVSVVHEALACEASGTGCVVKVGVEAAREVGVHEVEDADGRAVRQLRGCAQVHRHAVLERRGHACVVLAPAHELLDLVHAPLVEAGALQDRTDALRTVITHRAHVRGVLEVTLAARALRDGECDVLGHVARHRAVCTLDAGGDEFAHALASRTFTHAGCEESTFDVFELRHVPLAVEVAAARFDQVCAPHACGLAFVDACGGRCVVEVRELREFRVHLAVRRGQALAHEVVAADQFGSEVRFDLTLHGHATVGLEHALAHADALRCHHLFQVLLIRGLLRGKLCADGVALRHCGVAGHVDRVVHEDVGHLVAVGAARPQVAVQRPLELRARPLRLSVPPASNLLVDLGRRAARCEVLLHEVAAVTLHGQLGTHEFVGDTERLRQRALALGRDAQQLAHDADHLRQRSA